MSHHTVLLDANVLYPAPVWDAWMRLAITDLFKAKWTADIHREWIDSLQQANKMRPTWRREYPPW